MHVNIGIYNVEQRQINIIYFKVDFNNVRQRRNNVQRSIFERRFSQRWAASKQHCEHDQLKMKEKSPSNQKENNIFKLHIKMI